MGEQRHHQTTFLASEIDQIEQATPHVSVNHQRIDGDDRATRILVVHHGAVERVDISFGFAMAGEVTLDDSSIALTTPSHSSADGSLWDGSVPEPGQLWVYGPGSTQIGTYSPGSGSHFVSLPWEEVQRAAAASQIGLPEWRGHSGCLTSPGADHLVKVLSRGFDALDNGSDEIELVRTVVQALAIADPSAGTDRRGRRSTSREITQDVLNWIEANNRWFPSTTEICIAVAVSERRLRYAFVDVFQLSPGRYLRLRALNAVRSELVDPASLHRSITEIATDHGFRHLSLFTKHYRHTFGETPSATRGRPPKWRLSARPALAC